MTGTGSNTLMLASVVGTGTYVGFCSTFGFGFHSTMNDESEVDEVEDDVVVDVVEAVFDVVEGVVVVVFVTADVFKTVPGEVVSTFVVVAVAEVVVVVENPVVLDPTELVPLPEVIPEAAAGVAILNKASHLTVRWVLHYSHSLVPKYYYKIPRLKSGLSLGHVIQLCISLVAYGVIPLHC